METNIGPPSGGLRSVEGVPVFRRFLRLERCRLGLHSIPDVCRVGVLCSSFMSKITHQAGQLGHRDNNRQLHSCPTIGQPMVGQGQPPPPHDGCSGDASHGPGLDRTILQTRQTAGRNGNFVGNHGY